MNLLFSFRFGAKQFAGDLALIVNSLLLLFVYILGFGISIIFVKILKKKLLNLSFDKNVQTYWSGLNLGKKSLDEYYRQF